MVHMVPSDQVPNQPNQPLHGSGEETAKANGPWKETHLYDCKDGWMVVVAVAVGGGVVVVVVAAAAVGLPPLLDLRVGQG